MQQLPSSNTPTGMEKYLKYILLTIAGVAGFYFWGSISGFVVETLKNSLKTMIYGGILAFVLLFAWQYPHIITSSYKILAKKLQGVFIKMDPLSFMDRYADILSYKLKNLMRTKINLKGELISLIKQIEIEQTTLSDNLKRAAASRQMGKENQAASFALEAKGAQDSINLYTPNKIKLERNVQFLDEVGENWEISIKGIRSFNARKRTEYKILGKTAKALKQSEEFLRGDTPEAQMYQQSIKAAEDQMSQWLAYTEDFERQAKPILEGAQIEKRMNQNEGLQMLDSYMKDGKLLLPDFTKFDNIQDAEYVMVGNNDNKNSKFNLID